MRDPTFHLDLTKDGAASGHGDGDGGGGGSEGGGGEGGRPGRLRSCCAALCAWPALLWRRAAGWVGRWAGYAATHSRRLRTLLLLRDVRTVHIRRTLVQV